MVGKKQSVEEVPISDHNSLSEEWQPKKKPKKKQKNQNYQESENIISKSLQKKAEEGLKNKEEHDSELTCLEDSDNESEDMFKSQSSTSEDDDSEIIFKGYEITSKADSNQKRIDDQITTILNSEETKLLKAREEIDNLVKENKMLSSIGRLIVKYNKSQAKAIAQFNNLTHDQETLESKIRQISKKPKHLDEMEKMREAIFKISAPPRLILLQQKQLDIINERKFKYSTLESRSVKNLNRNIIKKMKSKVFRMENLKTITENKTDEKQGNDQKLEFDAKEPKSNVTKKPAPTDIKKDNQEKTKCVRKSRSKTSKKNLLKQEMIERAKKGHDEYCDTNTLQVVEVMPRKIWNLKKETFRYVNLAYNDQTIKNDLRLKINYDLTSEWEHWQLCAEGTKFEMRNAQIWNKTNKRYCPVTMSLRGDTQIVYKEEKTFTIGDPVEKWQNLTE